MSGTLNNIYNSVSYALYQQAKALAGLQEQVSTGSRINRVSDDPSATYQVLGLNTQDRSLGNYIDNVSEVASSLEISSMIIEGMISYFVEATSRLTQVTGGIYDDEARKRTAEEINQMLEQMVLLANTKNMNQYLFGGGSSGTAPYVVERTDGEITRVIYQGSQDDRNIEISPGMQSSIFYVGDDIFRSDNSGSAVFIGDTGAKAGTGTSNVKGDVWLTVIHDGSNYKISIDDGASYVTVPVGGDSNQAVTNSVTGEVLYVDTTEISGTGVELVRVPGTYDIFSALIGIRDILANKRELSSVQVEELLSNSFGSLDEIHNLLVQQSVSVGSKIGFLDDLKENLKGLKYNVEDETTRLEEADIAQLAIDISRREILYQMSLSVAAKLMSLSLLDFIE